MPLKPKANQRQAEIGRLGNASVSLPPSGGRAVVVGHVLGAAADEVQVAGGGVALEAGHGVRAVRDLGSLRAQGAEKLEAVVRVRLGQDRQVVLVAPQHAAHLVRQRLGRRAMVGRVVAQVELAERHGEAADADVERLDHRPVEVGHVRHEAVAAVADLRARRDVVLHLGDDLEVGLGVEPVRRVAEDSRSSWPAASETSVGWLT
jgi:hypothetical protein